MDVKEIEIFNYVDSCYKMQPPEGGSMLQEGEGGGGEARG